jgi:hypothetical protein
MRHRHLTDQAAPWSVVAIESILERGGATDVVMLLLEIQRDPTGEAAQNALIAVEHIRPYGYQRLIPTMIQAKTQ